MDVPHQQPVPGRASAHDIVVRVEHEEGTVVIVPTLGGVDVGKGGASSSPDVCGCLREQAARRRFEMIRRGWAVLAFMPGARGCG